MPVKEIVSEHEQKMEKAVEFLADELRAVRTARASTGLVENLKADFYGTPTPLKQMATLATPQSDTIIIKPFDPSSIREIEKTIKNSDLSIAPIVDGKLIRLTVPTLSAERRTQLVAQAKQLGEQAKVSLRNIRRDANKQFDQQQKDKIITEDDRENGKKKIDDLTKDHTLNIDKIVKNKSDEIMSD